jgi:hypothetical protein
MSSNDNKLWYNPSGSEGNWQWYSRLYCFIFVINLHLCLGLLILNLLFLPLLFRLEVVTNDTTKSLLVGFGPYQSAFKSNMTVSRANRFDS